jgi:23S rRNA (adenine2030-N6)-methyltransferase
MLSYQHGYHAGNFADVVKHIALTRIVDYLIQKEKPLFYLETHAGRGRYDFEHALSKKTAEFQEGVGRLWPHRKQLPAEFNSWIANIEAINTQSLRFYPGSPMLAVRLLRDIDRLYLCELHPQEFEALKTMPTQGKRVHFHKGDGIERLSSCLPPPEKRGFIFIDPAYEIKTEYQTIPEAIKRAYRKFATGVYCLWYPMVNEKLTEQLNRRMADIDCPNQLHIQFQLNASQHKGMTGCGLWVLNPPYILNNQMEIVLSTLNQYLNP